ncbi:hypothetical protein FRB95_001345 [Tulasnella sp. JGI-2019a]|nr:hypothetical protein FRB95_001345 [Tulasnella sp. JGI-2019a]
MRASGAPVPDDPPVTSDSGTVIPSEVSELAEKDQVALDDRYNDALQELKDHKSVPLAIQKQIQHVVYHSSDRRFIKMYLGNTWRVEEILKAVDRELSAIPILLMMESGYRLGDRFGHVARANEMYKLPFIWEKLSREEYDAGGRLAIVTTIYEMDLLPGQKTLIDMAHSDKNTLDRLNAFQQLDEASKTEVVSNVIYHLSNGYFGRFTLNQATELMEVIALTANPEKRLTSYSPETFKTFNHGLPENIKDIKARFLEGQSEEQRKQLQKLWNDLRSRVIKKAVSTTHVVSSGEHGCAVARQDNVDRLNCQARSRAHGISPVPHRGRVIEDQPSPRLRPYQSKPNRLPYHARG